jgi:hypothetical protein
MRIFFSFLISVVTIFVPAITFAITLDFQDALLSDIFNEITNQSKITLIYPSDVGVLTTSIAVQNVDVQTALNLILLPLDLDYERIDNDTYVVFSKKVKSFPRILGQYQAHYVDPVHLSGIIKVLGFDAYTFNGIVFFYVPSSDILNHILSVLESIDKRNDQLVILYRIERYSTNQFYATNNHIELSTALQKVIKEELKEFILDEIFGTLYLDFNAEDNKRILSYNDELVMEITNESSTDTANDIFLTIKTMQEALKIKREDLKASIDEVKSYTLRSGKDVFRVTLKVLPATEQIAMKMEEYTMDTIKENKNYLKINYTSSNTTFTVGARGIFSEVSVANKDLTLRSVTVGANLIDGLLLCLGYNYESENYFLTLTDILETEWIYFSPSIRYDISKNTFNITSETLLKFRFERFYLGPTIFTEGKIFFGMNVGLSDDTFAFGIFTDTNMNWGLQLKLKW